MSGGSFDYLYSRLGSREDYESIGKALAEYLAATGESRWIESQALLDIGALAGLLRVAEQVAARLSPVLREIEWHRSGDTGIESLVEAERAYAKKQHAETAV